MALRRVLVAYADQIENYSECAEELGLKDVPSCEDKKAAVLDASETKP